MTEKSLKMVNLDCTTLGEAWFRCIRELFESGYRYIISSGSFAGGERIEFDFITIRISKPGIRPLIPDVPHGLPQPTTMQYIEEEYLPYFMADHKEPNEQYTYGMYVGPQIPKVIEKYKKGGFENNQACMTIGDKNSIDLEDPPCLRLIDTRVRYGKLHFVVYFRSWDLWGGFPSNLAAIQLMKEDMAKELDVEDGEMIAVSKGLHLYGHHLELAKMVLRM